ncbi:exodeoxyribonuclease VII large subunit [Candidatus Cytomitobacter primus]|uniref:Exodeoxyribonuclease 7 large subunit n=1 Tax=Candidatus Cytomitobacter primus TaxID=2066024 RepID=A0A5C0UEI4_9PROT|nr:exodeoxyribonuclease VII large subunit [Candidatus Cytomitobacter primus]QEK38506.1 exodeoxyribonuclease VII large subunit [Candidatus Cytomitobacter primus]
MNESIGKSISSHPTFGVKSLSISIKKMLESSYSKIYIKGQISQPKRMNHLYFSLKEEDAVIDCVAWANVKLPFEPQHDMEIICCGRISSYPGRSKYQVIVLSIEHIGDSQVLEKRKLALQKEGLFDPARKLKLPKYPRKIGIITSPVGAVLHDMLHRLRDRYPCEILFYPVSVQGAGTASSVVSAINYFNSFANECKNEYKIQEIEQKMESDNAVENNTENVEKDIQENKKNIQEIEISKFDDQRNQKNHKVDLIIVARGGGSFEDLWGFQDEELVRVIAHTKIPLITAIGHETDTTLSDYASSCRAPTPTAAIELAFPDRKELCTKLNNYDSKIKGSTLFYIENRFKNKLVNLKIKSPKEIILPIKQSLQSQIMRKDYAYSKYWNEKHNIINSVEKCKLNIQPLQQDLIYRLNRINEKYKQFMIEKKNQMHKLIDTMKNISYEDTLKRGFCRATIDGKLIKYKADAPEKFEVEFQDGSLLVQKIYNS